MPIFELTKDAVVELPDTRFGDHGVGERGDLQRLLRDKIEVVAPDVLVVAEEFADWDESRRRIDLLGVDRDANLVVIELKRDESGGHMELQAIRYAAMVSTMTFERVVGVYQDYLDRRGLDGDAGERLLAFLGWDEADEERFAADVRIVLVSAEFSKEVTTAVLWLNERELDIRCVRLRPQTDGTRLFLEVQQIVPLPEASEYLVGVRQKAAEARVAAKERGAWEGDWYVNLGMGSPADPPVFDDGRKSHRHWQWCREFGYVAAGGRAVARGTPARRSVARRRNRRARPQRPRHRFGQLGIWPRRRLAGDGPARRGRRLPRRLRQPERRLQAPPPADAQNSPRTVRLTPRLEPLRPRRYGGVMLRLLILALFGVALLPAAASARDSLKAAAGDRFVMGTAVTSEQVKKPDVAALVVRQFGHVTPEYELFPQFVHPEPDQFTFERADAVVDFAAANKMPVVGHMLVWGNFTPDWMFAGADAKPLPREAGLANLRAHIEGVMRHYEGKISEWHVVNEAISDDADQYLRDTPALRSIGDDYVVQAFKIARETMPDAKLIYNDYNIEDPAKLEKTLRLLGELKAAGVKADAVGIQGHWLIDYPSPQTIDAALTALAAAGYPVCVTELDVDPLPRPKGGADLNDIKESGENPYPDGFPADQQKRLAERYAAIFEVLVRHSADVGRVTFWGVDDGQSWLNGFPVKGRTNYPLLFGRDLEPKPAYQSVLKVLQ